MRVDVRQKNSPDGAAADQRPALEKHKLALDALSKLTKQFAKNADFGELVHILVMTISGQFSTSSVFAAIRDPGSNTERDLFFATGKFKNSPSLPLLAELAVDMEFFLNNPQPCRVDDLPHNAGTEQLIHVLQQYDVRLVAPLVQSEKCIGIIGLGQKVNRKPYDRDEVEFLGTLINSVTPLIANSFLFMEIADLNQWYLDIMDSVKDGVYVFDEKYRLIKVNRPGYDILKMMNAELPDAELLPGSPLELVFNERQFPGWIRFLRQAMSDSHNKLLQNVVAKDADVERIFNVRVMTITHDGQNRVDRLITLDDITTLKENERRMFDLEKFAERGLMASAISHELNNFLGMILGGVEIAELAIEKNETTRAEESLDKVKDGLMRMTRFTTGLMDYAKMDTRKHVADLNAVIKDVLSFVIVQKRYTNVAIETTLDPDIPTFEMDPDQIAQLLLNFMNNAIDAIVEAGRTGGRIGVKTEFAGRQARLIVSDNGVGITPEIQEKLFRIRLTTKATGHGYGLVTCAKIIDNHRGRVEIDSEPGIGTIFTILFDITPMDEEPPVPSTSRDEHCDGESAS